jgi:hypothetical protein
MDLQTFGRGRISGKCPMLVVGKKPNANSHLNKNHRLTSRDKLNLPILMNNILRFVLFMVPLGLPVTNTFGATPTRPSVTFTSPKNGARWSNDVFTVTGKVNYADNGSVLPPTVWYSSNRGSWAQTDTTLGKGSGTWSAQVTLTPGTNSIAVYAVEEVTEN